MELNFAVTYFILENGPSDDPFSLFMQIAGVFASAVTTAWACTEWRIFTNFYSYDPKKDHQLPSKKLHNLKALLFFAPHVLFRTTSTAVVAAFLKIYSLIPLTVFAIISVVITCFLHKSRKKEDLDSFPLSLFAPSVSDPESKFGWSLLKATMLASTLTLLPCLILIWLLPLLSPETTSCTLALSHLNHSSPIPDCSPCFNLTATNSTFTGDKTPLQTNPGTPCVMMITLDDFSTYFFLPLLLLGVWCLFEGGIYLILSPTSTCLYICCNFGQIVCAKLIQFFSVQNMGHD